MSVQGIIMLVLLLAVLAVFFLVARRLIRALMLGQPEENRLDSIGERIKSVVVFVAAQARVLSQPAGLGHFVIFWGFIFITLGTIEHILGMIVSGFSYRALFGDGVAGVISFCQDILAFLVLVAIVVSVFRRFVLKPVRLETDDPKVKIDATFILALIFVLILLMYGMKGAGIIMDEVDPGYAPVSAIAAGMIEGRVGNVEAFESYFAWAHHLIIFFFLIYIPFSKHIHILGAIPNVFLRKLGNKGTLRRMDFEDESAEKFGKSNLTDFTWKQLLDLYACTECGRCQAACPAYLTGKTLSPFKVIHNLREHLMSEMKPLLSDGEYQGEQIVPEVVSDESMWDCTTCGACLQECPPFIEHVQAIVDLRRYFVLTEASFPQEAQPVFRNMEVNYNPWAFGYADRANWSEGLDVPLASDKKSFDVLYWVGCAGSFDDRGKEVARAMVKLLTRAGVDFAILGTEEKCCGDSARRLGNEYLAQMLIDSNIETMRKYSFKRIVTACPHGYNALKVEYPQFGFEAEVLHHSQLLLELIREGKLKDLSVEKSSGIYHDSCYLGRYNDVIDQPRDLLESIRGVELREFDRKKKRSFCCGAGGGRMWLEETAGERINESRVDEALAEGAGQIFTACPFCMTMFEDGLKAKDNEEVQVRDIAEILLAANQNGDSG
ncbi:MAG: 4Fe-4S dicluster domain-containing protein [Candidatus Latescibacteria bacterium]|nr:4Fe-4S dicluster domain-containing protein [bacterium]MBD3423593.1 4Fe-4S dicluster domain-containing protein [Candidatus Latescibacterota bacterium]